jgi:formin 2
LLQADNVPVKLNVGSYVQGDVVLECLHVGDGPEDEKLMFRVMFNTFFIQSHILLLTFEDIDISWDADHKFTKNFKAEVGYDFSCMHVVIRYQIYQC